MSASRRGRSRLAVAYAVAIGAAGPHLCGEATSVPLCPREGNVAWGSAAWFAAMEPDLLLRDDGVFVTAVSRTGVTIASLIGETTWATVDLTLPYRPFVPAIEVIDDTIVVLWSGATTPQDPLKVYGARIAMDLPDAPVSPTLLFDGDIGIYDLVKVDSDLVALVGPPDRHARLYSIRSRDGGRTWSEPVLVGDEEHWWPSSVRLAWDGEERVYCLFGQQAADDETRHTTILYASDDRGGRWTRIESPVLAGYRAIFMSVVAAGDVVVIAGTPPGPLERGTSVVWSPDRGKSWIGLTEVGDRGTGYEVLQDGYVAIDRDGRWHVTAITHLEPDPAFGHGDLVRLWSDDQGATWSEPDTLSCGFRTVQRRNEQWDYRMAVRGRQVVVAYQSNDVWATIRVAADAGPLHAVTPPVVDGFRASLTQNPGSIGDPVHLRVSVPAAAELRATIFDVGGRRVRAWDRSVERPATEVLRWDGTDERGVRVGAGVYFWRVGDAAEKFATHTVRQVMR